MNRGQKEEVVVELGRKLDEASVAVVARLVGLNVGQANRLRQELREVQGEARVAKNTLAKRAIGGRLSAAAERWLEDQTTLVFGFGDPIPVTKIVARWADEQSEKLTIKGGIFGGELLDPERVVALSKTPPMDELRATLLGVLQAPAAKLVRLLAEPGSSLARVLAARKDALPPEGAE